jgi:dihydroorotate dehydrogenase electron transfer subunit
MLKIVARIADDYRVPCEVSLEERMACGVGVCLGCPVKVKTHGAKDGECYEYKMVCKDGPVFDAKKISW